MPEQEFKQDFKQEFKDFAMAMNPLIAGGRRMLLACALAHLPLLASAAPGCTDVPYAIDASKVTLGPRHHPLGRPLPSSANFNQPERCVDAIWFFDQNHNGIADAGEVRVFGAQRQVDCASCHGEVPNAGATPSAALFLRQDAATLCLVCHRL